MLKFLGTGGAFSPDLGNCAAYYKNDKFMILFDCEETTFHDLLKNNILEGVQNLFIIITHFHSDHIGSLGSLLFYTEKVGINNVNVIYPQLEKLQLLITLFGVQNVNSKLLEPQEVFTFNIKEYKQVHSFMEAYGYLIRVDQKNIYYSGDTKIIPKEIIQKVNKSQIDFFYQDVRLDENDYHMSLKELKKIFPSGRDKITCMHYQSENEISTIKKEGFKCALKLNKTNSSL